MGSSAVSRRWPPAGMASGSDHAQPGHMRGTPRGMLRAETADVRALLLFPGRLGGTKTSNIDGYEAVNFL